MKNSNNTSLFQREQVRESLKQSLIKLHPGMMMRNPIMFTVEIATMIMLLVTVYSLFSDGQGDFLYNFLVFVILFLTLLFANFAEAIAEARGKAQADSLRRTREETPAKLIVPKRLMVNDIPRGQIIANTGEKVDGMEAQALRGSVFMWTHQEPYMQIEEAGEVSLYIRTNSGSVSFRVVSTDIQTNNGVVQAMGYAFDLNKI